MGVGNIVVVTDSTCGLPDSEIARLGIDVVPVLVVVDHESLREGIDITPSEVADKLRSGARLTTSRPSPEHFLAAYQRAADQGAAGVVSVHLSTELSGTCQAARLAARRSPIPVEVVDTKTVAMAAGYAVIDAAESAQRGADLDQCAAAARTTAQQSRAFFYVDTLEYLRRGGRIGAAQRYVGQALQMKPLLGMSEGAVVPLEKVRTAAKALSRMVDLAVARCDEVDRPRLAVQHLQAQESADKVAADLGARVPDAPCLLSDIGAVLGVHTGPGLVAVMVVPGAAP